MIDYYSRYVDLCRQTYWGKSLLDARTRAIHNKAMKHLGQLERKMYSEEDRCEEIAYKLLLHENDVVKLNSAAYCIKAQVWTKIAYQVLSQIANNNIDKSLAGDALMTMKYCKPFER